MRSGHRGDGRAFETCLYAKHVPKLNIMGINIYSTSICLCRQPTFHFHLARSKHAGFAHITTLTVSVHHHVTSAAKISYTYAATHGLTKASVIIYTTRTHVASVANAFVHGNLHVPSAMPHAERQCREIGISSDGLHLSSLCVSYVGGCVG